jgi:hypothetical protein
MRLINKVAVNKHDEFNKILKFRDVPLEEVICCHLSDAVLFKN